MPEESPVIDPRREARERVGGRFDARVLEPSPPAIGEPPWFADDPVNDPSVPDLPVLAPVPMHGRIDVGRGRSSQPDLAPWCADRLARSPPLVDRPGTWTHYRTDTVLARARRTRRRAGALPVERQDRLAVHARRLRYAVLRRRRAGAGRGRFRLGGRPWSGESRSIRSPRARAAAGCHRDRTGAPIDVCTPTTPLEPGPRSSPSTPWPRVPG